MDKQAGDIESKRGKYALVLLPLSVVLREGCEAVVFLGGTGLNDSGTSIPIAATVGAACGVLVGYLLYTGCTNVGFKWFLMISTALLLIISSGLFSGSVHELEEYTQNERFVWKLYCCHEETDGIWKTLNAVFGWRDEATVGTLCADICYWIFVVACFYLLRLKWKRDAEREAAEFKLLTFNRSTELATAA